MSKSNARLLLAKIAPLATADRCQRWKANTASPTRAPSHPARNFFTRLSRMRRHGAFRRFGPRREKILEQGVDLAELGIAAEFFVRPGIPVRQPPLQGFGFQGGE